jgi:tetratricopeptide (TPR) repeat protein
VKLLQRRGEWREAWAIITEEQLKQPENDDELWQLKAQILETLQWSDELRHVINNDLKYFGERKPQPFIFKTRSLMSCEKYREAVVVLEEALLSHPNNSELLMSLAECYLRLHIRISEVRRILTRLRAHNPSDPSLLQKQIEMLLKLQQSSSSSPSFVNEINNLLFSLCNEHLQQSPNASLYTLRGRLYLSQNQITEALNDFTTAIKLIPPSTLSKHIITQREIISRL